MDNPAPTIANSYNTTDIAEALFPKVVLGGEITESVASSESKSVKDALAKVFTTFESYNLSPTLFTEQGDVKVVTNALKVSCRDIMHGHNPFRYKNSSCKQFIYCRRCWNFTQEDIGQSFAYPIAQVKVIFSKDEDCKNYGGIKVLKVYPHNKHCTTPNKYLTHVRMQTRGTGFDLFQFDREVILGTLLDGLVDKVNELHKANKDPGEYQFVVQKLFFATFNPSLFFKATK
jgi:hypothetical protein